MFISEIQYSCIKTLSYCAYNNKLRLNVQMTFSSIREYTIYCIKHQQAVATAIQFKYKLYITCII